MSTGTTTTSTTTSTTTNATTNGPTNGPTQAPPAPPPVPLRRNWRFQALWAGQAGSTLGLQIIDTAYPLLLLALTGSSTLAAAFGRCRSAPPWSSASTAARSPTATTAVGS